MKTSSALSWGRVHRFAQELRATDDIKPDEGQTLLPYGLGRSYGDSCLNENGVLIDTKKLDHFVAFDRLHGIITCEAGVTLRDILLLCATPNDDGSYWFLPVMPGTKFVTIGGAIANDVHGKNHHGQGNFGRHVAAFRLRRSNGEILNCSSIENAGFFHATIGGLGLTGFIEQATLRLMRVPGLQVEVEEIVQGNLDAFFLLAAESEETWDYTVAWVDCTAQGEDVGRGIFSRARHIEGSIKTNDLQPKITVPVEMPFSFINSVTLPLLNKLYRSSLLGAASRLRKVSYDKFFFPLDAIGEWNKLYGRAGFYQYQCVIPTLHAQSTIRAQLEEIAKSGEGSFLVVLKNFGKLQNMGMMSFPMPGTTLAIDFPNRGESTLALLDRLDAMTLAAGGRVYAAKDGRMTGASFQRYYPSIREFYAYIDPRFSSSLWRRVMEMAS